MTKASPAPLATSAVPKPQPTTRPELSVQVVTRITPDSRERIKALADREGITIQQLGLYAWSLAMEAYGEKPLPEANG